MSTDVMQRAGGATMTGIGLAGQMVAGNQEANAYERMASAVQGEARGQQSRVYQLSQATSQELTQIDKQIRSADTELARKQSLMATLDPAFMEAGKQALQLLRGQQAASLAPMQAERDRQRNNLVQELQSTMGPGAQNSAAGAEQLKQFDAESVLLTNQAQQNQLQTLLGTSLNARPDINSSIAQLGGMMGEMSNIQSRQIAAIQNNSFIPYAGMQYAGDLFRAQMYSNMSRNVTNTGMQQWTQGTSGGGGGGGGGGMGSMGGGGGGGGGITGGGMPSSGGGFDSIAGGSGMAGGPMDAGGITGGGGEMGGLMFA